MARRRSVPDGLPRLWAPWRSGYLTQAQPRGCLFCLIRRRSARDRQHQVICRSASCLALLNRYPYNNGHLLIAPARHCQQLDQLTDEELTALWRCVARCQQLLQHALHPAGYNIGINQGRAGGAGIPGHLHVHLVPRWIGDTNCMPVVAGTKVISQSLAEVYRLLRHAAQRC